MNGNKISHYVYIIPHYARNKIHGALFFKNKRENKYPNN